MIDFYQIIYSTNQLPSLYKWARPYHNTTLSPFFENSVISELVTQSTADKIAVCSHALRHKMKTMNVPPRVELTYEHLEQEFDVLSFSRNTRAHQMLEALDLWHPGAKELLKQICLEVGIQWSNEVRNPIYWNGFCAKREIYQAYVKDALKPAMEVMEGKFREQCYQDSNYYKLKNPDDQFAARVKKDLGLDYCPLHPFLLERLFSVWINKQDLNVRYL